MPCSGATGAGSLLIGRTLGELAVLQEKVKMLNKAGLGAVYLSASSLALEEPALDVGPDWGAVFYLDDCQLDAQRTVSFIQQVVFRPFLYPWGTGNSQGRYAEVFNDPAICLLRCAAMHPKNELVNLASAECSAIFLFSLALVGVFFPYNRGALFTALVVIYALTSGQEFVVDRLLILWSSIFVFLFPEHSCHCIQCHNSIAIRYHPYHSPYMGIGNFTFVGPPWMNLVAPTLVSLLKFYFHEEVRKATISAIMFSQVGSGEGTCLRAR
ncbi:hypothetical protein Taro_039617 [Colocasia esculenta]|uniref:Uncharacterized protein n=1 Tax=Colocasia esculenta TaxID=4460 RepID=A0A843WQN3_COLES|nr:hypothetical protein [Colocasia esculenta]